MLIFDPDIVWEDLGIYRSTGRASNDTATQIMRLSEAIVMSTCPTRGDVEDIIQECAVKALGALLRYDISYERSKLHVFLSRVITNRCKDLLKRRYTETANYLHPMDPVVILQTLRSDPTILSGVYDLYASMEQDCREIIIPRFVSMLPEDINDVFSLMYEVAIPSGISGGRRGAIRAILRESNLENRWVAGVLHDVSVFIIRLGILNLLHLADEVYDDLREGEELTLMPEFRIAYLANDADAAVELLNGLTVKFEYT